jgi:hypothetical protein
LVMPDTNTPNSSAPAAANAPTPEPSAVGAEASSFAGEAAAELKKLEIAAAAFIEKVKAKAKAELPQLEAEFAKLETEVSPALAWIKDKLRASPLLIVFAIAFAIVFSINPAKAGLALWGVARVGLFAWLGYWVDRIIFGRLRGLTGIDLGTAWKRRALIVSACLVAGALIP